MTVASKVCLSQLQIRHFPPDRHQNTENTASISNPTSQRPCLFSAVTKTNLQSSYRVGRYSGVIVSHHTEVGPSSLGETSSVLPVILHYWWVVFLFTLCLFWLLYNFISLVQKKGWRPLVYMMITSFLPPKKSWLPVVREKLAWAMSPSSLSTVMVKRPRLEVSSTECHCPSLRAEPMKTCHSGWRSREPSNGHLPIDAKLNGYCPQIFSGQRKC